MEYNNELKKLPCVIREAGISNVPLSEFLESAELLHESDKGIVVAFPVNDLYVYKNDDREWQDVRLCEKGDDSYKKILINNGYSYLFSFHTLFKNNHNIINEFELYIGQ